MLPPPSFPSPLVLCVMGQIYLPLIDPESCLSLNKNIQKRHQAFPFSNLKVKSPNVSRVSFKVYGSENCKLKSTSVIISELQQKLWASSKQIVDVLMLPQVPQKSFATKIFLFMTISLPYMLFLQHDCFFLFKKLLKISPKDIMCSAA